MKKILNNLSRLSYLILIATITFSLYLNYPETQILADPNDNIFQYSLVYRTNWIWENYDCPLSLSCFPNLIDHAVTTWAEGYPLPFYYSHIPQIAIVASYNLVISPLITFLNYSFTLYQYYNLTKYLLLCFFPLSVFFALRLVGFSPLVSSFAAFFASHFSTDGLYGIDPPSYLWRGYGLTSQLYAMSFLPLGLAFAYRALKDGRDTFWAILFLTLTTSGHLGIGIIGILSILPFLFLDLNLKNIVQRVKKLFFIFGFLFLVLSYWIIPILLANNYHMISFWDPIWKFNSYGWYEVIKQFFQGEIFDWQRGPIITSLVTAGFFTLALNTSLFPFSLLFLMWMFLYFGRTTWGGLIDLIPGMKDFHQHRFIVGVHLAALFLIPAGVDLIFQIFQSLHQTLHSAIKTPRFKTPRLHLNQGVTLAILPKVSSVIFISILAYFTLQKTIDYASLNNRWIGEANSAYLYDEKNFKDLRLHLKTLPNARIYAGRPGNWGKDFRLGSTQMYMLLGVNGFDISQFLPETWSPLSENEQNFDERVLEDYDLLNIRYIVANNLPAQAGNHDFPQKAKMTKRFGPFELYQVPTSGWFDVVTSPMFVKTDKTNFINLVHLWHRSYPRRWKMHPLISVERKAKIPKGVQKVITMVDEVSYQDTPGATRRGSTGVKNIFSDFPFVFPEATVSARLEDTPGATRRGSTGVKKSENFAIISNEKVDKQTYSATIDVPANCRQCMIMFKVSFHPNWQVQLDGKSTSKFAVFPFYLATTAPPGSHTVEFTYQPNKLKVVLLVGEILIGALLLFFKKMKLL